MTWLGKILAVVVMLLSLVWMWLTAADYSTRVNWKAQREEYKKAFEEARTARQSEHNRHQAEMEALYKMVDSSQKAEAALKAEVGTLAKANKDNKSELDRLVAAVATADKTVTQIQAAFDGAVKELNIVRDRNNKLEQDRQTLTISQEIARREALAATNDARLQLKIAEDLARQNDDLRALNTELRANGGRPRDAVEASVSRGAPPVPENLRGTVTAYDPAISRDLLEISLGLDAGLTFGSRLDIYRLEGGGKHLGTLIVQSVRAKSAVAKFVPADPNRTVTRLRADELPKVGDLVGPLGGPNGGGLR